MGLNFRNFSAGINIVPSVTGSSSPTVQGDLAVSSVDGNLYYNNGTSIVILDTNSNSNTLTNKTINGNFNTITNISLTTAVSGILPIANGGTGQTTSLSAFNALSPMTSGGDLIYGGVSGSALRLANGSSGQVLTSAGTTLAPFWATPSPGFVNPMTSVGDMIIGGIGGAATRLAATTNGYILTLVSGSPAWQPNSGGGGTVTSVTASSPLASSGGTTPNISFTGTLAIANGGTGSATQNFVDLTTAQNIGGAKTFTTSVTGNILNTSSYINFTQISTPSNPSSGSNDLYFKSDGNLYTLNSSGIESLIGGSNSIVYYSGYMLNAGGAWTTSSTVFADPTNSGNNTLTTRQSHGITVTAGTSPTNVAGITFTPPSTSAAYLITASFGLFGSNGPNLAFQLTDGTTAIVAQAVSFPTAGQDDAQVLSGIYVPGTTSPVTVKIQLATSSGTIEMARISNLTTAIEWTVIQIPNSGSGGGSGVSSLNSLTGSLNITAGSGITVTPSGGNIQIASTGGGGNPFDFFSSSQITTNSSANSSTTFTTFSNDPGFSFTPNFTGTYKVYSFATLEGTVGSANAFVRIANTVGGATLLNEQDAGMFDQVGTNQIMTIPTQSIFSLSSGTSYTFAIQGKVSAGGSCSLNGSFNPMYIFAERIG